MRGGVVMALDCINYRANTEYSNTLCAKPNGGYSLNFINPVMVCDCRGNGDGKTTATLTGDHQNRVTDYTSVVCMASPQTNAEILEDKAPTLLAGHEKPIMCGEQTTTYQNTGFAKYKESDISSTLRAQTGDLPCTMQSAQGKSPVEQDAPKRRYIVRRLTPLECNRLQGFYDGWGEIEHKDSFTDEEFEFWQDVKATHARINGKPYKPSTPEALLKWYNKLHSDSAEYKMWGNGIALPCAQFVLEGVAMALRGELTDDNV